MKNYNVIIKEQNKDERCMTVRVEDEEDFVKWMEVLTNFEEEGKITYEEIEIETEPEAF